MIMSFLFLCKNFIIEIPESILPDSTIIVAFTNNLLYNTADELQREQLKQNKLHLVSNTEKWTIDGEFKFLQHFLF